MFLMSGEPLYRRVAEETILNMETFFSEHNLFFAASDADSDGEEGGYYLYDYRKAKIFLEHQGWTPEDVEEGLAYFGIEEDGNVDGELSHLHVTSSLVPKRMSVLKQYLKIWREGRTFPFVDRKVITAWNAMMIKALFVAGKIDRGYTQKAQKHLDTLLQMLYRKGVLYHQALWGVVPKQPALLEDYAFLTDALIEGYERTYDAHYLELAEKFAKEAWEKYYRGKVWYMSHDSIGTAADFDDRYYTSPLSVMLESFLKLSSLLEKREFLEIVEESIETNDWVLKYHPADVSRFIQLYLRVKRGDVCIHAKKNALYRGAYRIDRVTYPFLLSSVGENHGYLACGTGYCFSQENNLSKLLDKIMWFSTPKQAPLWQSK
jgi:uncharacterized protein YyaL (SSP411 family)